MLRQCIESHCGVQCRSPRLLPQICECAQCTLPLSVHCQKDPKRRKRIETLNSPALFTCLIRFYFRRTFAHCDEVLWSPCWPRGLRHGPPRCGRPTLSDPLESSVQRRVTLCQVFETVASTQRVGSFSVILVTSSFLLENGQLFRVVFKTV